MSILQDIYDSELNFKLSTFWDGGFDAEFGDRYNGFKASNTLETFAAAEAWLSKTACETYPSSGYAKRNWRSKYAVDPNGEQSEKEGPGVYAGCGVSSDDAGWLVYVDYGRVRVNGIESYDEASQIHYELKALYHNDPHPHLAWAPGYIY